MARILVVTNTPHIPATSGYSQRVSAVVAAMEDAGHTVQAVSIRPLFADFEVPKSASLNGRLHTIAAPLRVLARLLRTPSLSLFKWYSPRAAQLLSRTTEMEFPPEVVIIESSYLAPYQVLFNCPVIYDLHNIESQLIGNFANRQQNLTARAAHFESRWLQRLEASIPRRANGIATVSETDRETLTNIAHKVKAPIIAAPNGVNDEAFEVPDSLAEAEAPTAVFIGHLGWHPNIEGAIWLACEVWPQVRTALPNARLQLVGREPNPAVQALADPASGISVHGDVPSVLPYLATAAVATAPLWTAGGTRLKILEALGAATPVVSTSLGALGLENLAAGGVLEIAEDPADFAAALVRCLSQPAKSPAARQAAEPFRWSNTLTGLVDMVNDAVK